MPRKPESPQIVGPRQPVEVDHTVYVSAPQTVETGPMIYAVKNGGGRRSPMTARASSRRRSSPRASR